MTDYDEEQLPDKKGISVIKVKLNPEEKAWLKKGMEALSQMKPSTALKQLAKIGYAEVVLNEKTRLFSELILGNLKRNKERGFSLDDDLKPIIKAKVDQVYDV